MWPFVHLSVYIFFCYIYEVLKSRLHFILIFKILFEFYLFKSYLNNFLKDYLNKLIGLQFIHMNYFFKTPYFKGTLLC